MRSAVIAAVVAATTGAGLAAIAPAAVAATGDNRPPTSSAAIVARAAGGFETFYRAFDSSVYQRTITSGAFSAATPLGGRIIGAPAAAAAGDSIVLAARGTDSAVWVKTRTNGTWSPWLSIGGRVGAAPAVAEGADGRIQIFARGPGYDLWTRSRTPDGTWSAWSSAIGGDLSATTAPAAVALPDRTLLFAVDQNHDVRYREADTHGGPLTPWQYMPEASTVVTYVAPSVAADSAGQTVTVAVRGFDNQLLVDRRGSAGWSGWARLGGRLIDAPSVASAVAGAPAGFARVVVRGTDDAVWTRYLMNGTWSAFTRAWTPATLPAVPSWLRGADWTRIPTTSKVVALTFDGGANDAGLPSILSTLLDLNVPATFMLTGEFVRTFPAESNEIALSGFVVGNHSDTHPDFTTLSDAQVAAEVNTARTAIRTTTGAETRPIFRFPSGARNARVITDVNNLGYVPVRWTVDTLGFEGTSGGQSVQSVIDRVIGGAQPGEIVLMHVGSNPKDHTTLDASALPTVIARLRALGYSFTTLRALTG